MIELNKILNGITYEGNVDSSLLMEFIIIQKK